MAQYTQYWLDGLISGDPGAYQVPRPTSTKGSNGQETLALPFRISSMSCHPNSWGNMMGIRIKPKTVSKIG